MSRRRVAHSLLFLLFIAVAAPVLAAEPPSVAGRWQGTIDLAGSKLGFDVDLSLKEDGTWAGDISIPVQGARDLPLANIRIEGEGVSFEMPGVPGSPVFKGRVSEDGAAIAGEFTQGGQTFPFEMARAAAPEATAREALEGWDEYVLAAMKDFEVPGLAMAIVRDGKVVLAKGYGLRDVKRGLPVTSGTLFAIGSSTKAFTTFVMSTLVDEGRLEWDEPVAEYIPGFTMHDTYATERLTPRDLVTHRSGLPRHDALWYNSDLTREEMVERLRHLEPFRDLRAEYHYQNLMFLTAGYLIERITGQSWEDAVRARILQPLGMTRTNFSVRDSQKSDDFALPYEERDDEVREMPFRDITNVGPAGSINSTADDMAKWVLAQLGHAGAGDGQIISKAALEQMHLPQMAISVKPERPEMPSVAYGLGWFVEPYRGRERVHHGGNIDGFTAQVSLMPRDDIGMVALANMNGTPLPELLVRHAMDRLLKLDPIDWVADAKVKRARGKEAQKEAEKKKEAVRRAGTKPAHDLAEYAGDYEHPGYGLLRIELKGDRLEATYNKITTPLEHWHYEVFNGAKAAKDPTFEDMKFMFRTNMKGDVEAVEAPFEPEVPNIVFSKKADARLFDPEFLRQFVGKYEVAGEVSEIALKGNVLTLTVPGQPVYELAPDRGTEFNLKRISGFSVRFVVDPEGGVTEALFIQPNGVFTAKRVKP